MRMREISVAIIACALVAVVVAFGWIWMRDLFEASVDTADPNVVADAYLAAWSEGDYPSMLELVRGVPEGLEERHRQMLDGLGATGLELGRGELREEVDGRAVLPVEVLVDVDYSEQPLSWDVQLTLIRERGEWSVVHDLAAIHPELHETWEFGTETEPVDRSPILAIDGTALAGSGTLITIGFEPSAVSDPDGMVEAFESAVPGSGARAQREIDRGNLVDGWFYPVVTLTEDRGDRAWSQLRGVPGVLRQTSHARSLVDDGFAQHVVGIIAEATAEQLEQLREAGEDVEPGVRIPQYGLERELDDQLVGSDLVRAGIREPDGPMRVIIAETQANPSGPVHTTIDVDVQRAVEDALADVELPAGFVVVDVDDGAIRASASRPLSSYNRAFSGRFPPGSTFKIVTAEAVLADGTDPDDEIGCPAETIVGGLRVPNAGGLDGGEVTLREAFTLSCNTSFAMLGAQLGGTALSDAAARFGFGVDPLVPLTAFGGSFPDPTDTAEVAAASFGQARVEASVLHMASVAAAAETGMWRQPYLLVDDGPSAGSQLDAGATGPLREMLRDAVDDGTGRAAAVEGHVVRGKTGTAQADGTEHAWFAGTFGGYGFAVIVEGGGSGGEVAAPLAAAFVELLVDLTGADRGD